jgi:DNA-binding transcriptional MerR regulator
MKSFTINDLERFSGIKAHTLRIWERRYSLVTPGRSSGNFRLYTLEELKKILDIALLQKNGYRISVLSKISSEDIKDKIEHLSIDYIKWQKAINDLTINMYTIEPESFEKNLDELLLNWPIDILMEKIIFPFLYITGLLWSGNKLDEEHLVVTAIRKNYYSQ